MLDGSLKIGAFAVGADAGVFRVEIKCPPPSGAGDRRRRWWGAHNIVHTKESKTPAESKNHASEYDERRMSFMIWERFEGVKIQIDEEVKKRWNPPTTASRSPAP